MESAQVGRRWVAWQGDWIDSTWENGKQRRYKMHDKGSVCFLTDENRARTAGTNE